MLTIGVSVVSMAHDVSCIYESQREREVRVRTRPADGEPEAGQGMDGAEVNGDGGKGGCNVRT